MAELNETIVFRADLTRPLTTNEMDRNFKMVSNPFSKNRMYNKGNIVYHNITIKDKEVFCWFRANTNIPKGNEFNQENWDVIGVDFDKIDEIEKEINVIKSWVSPTKDTKDGSDAYLDSNKLKIKIADKETNVKLQNDNGLYASFNWLKWDDKNNVPLRIIKDNFDSIEIAKECSTKEGTLVIDTKTDNIFVGNHLIGSNVKDIVIEPYEGETEPSVLKIWKNGNQETKLPDYVLDFHDMASASEIEKVFETMTVNGIKFQQSKIDNHLNVDILGSDIKIAKKYDIVEYPTTDIKSIDDGIKKNAIISSDKVDTAIKKLDEKISLALTYSKDKPQTKTQILGENDKDYNNIRLVNIRVEQKGDEVLLHSSVKTQTIEKANDGYIIVKEGEKLDPKMNYYSYDLVNFKFIPYDTEEFGYISNGNCFTKETNKINDGLTQVSDVKRVLEILRNATYWKNYE